jgi:nicotinamide-nucleotide amidase
MRAELLSVGTELLLGEIVDTNSAYLAQELAQRGVDVLWSQRVGDNHERLRLAIRQALERSDLLIMCGGLGPTDDDMTREAIASVVDETPEVDPDLEATLRGRFRAYGRPMPDMNLKQAWLIPSAQALPNPLGTAPGWFVTVKDKRIVALPGPPRELKRMWSEEALPRLELPEAALFTRTFKTYGIGESGIAELLGELTLAANPSVATYAHRDGVHVRVAAKAGTLADATALAGPVVESVQQILAGHVWGLDKQELPQLIVERLADQHLTVATMESLTGGMVGEMLTSVAGASAIYPGGVVAYSSQVKAAFGVPTELLERHGSVSREVAGAMAEAAARLFSADYGLATTGVAGPGQSEGKDAGEVYVAVFRARHGVTVQELRLPPLTRDWIRERTTFAVLSLLWKLAT